MKERIALYQGEFGNYVISGDFPKDEQRRLTEFVEVDFPDLPKETIIANKVAVIDNQIAGAMERINRLKADKQELLALEHTS